MHLHEELPVFRGITHWLNEEATNEDLQGFPTLVHFWSISCGPCKQTMSRVRDWHVKYGADGLKFVGIHMPRSDADKNVQAVKQIVERFKLVHPIAIDQQLVMTDIYENKRVPAFYLFDRDGKLRHHQVGSKGLELLEQRMEKIVAVRV